MLSPLNPARDLRISGQVIYTGTSSMEVAVKMESIGNGIPEETVMIGIHHNRVHRRPQSNIGGWFIGRFSMVCRNATTHRASKVNPLIISTTEERDLYSLGEHMKKRRQSNVLRSLSRVPPSSSEAAGLHSFYLQHGQEEDGIDVENKERVWMGDTTVEKCMLMFPQERK
jgi:acyl-coenzyme A thioesterase 9